MHPQRVNLELTLTQDQLESGCHSGSCDESIKELTKEDDDIVAQLSNLKEADVDDYLLEHDLSICSNLDNTPLSVKYEYVLWMACADCLDDPESYIVV